MCNGELVMIAIDEITSRWEFVLKLWQEFTEWRGSLGKEEQRAAEMVDYRGKGTEVRPRC